MQASCLTDRYFVLLSPQIINTRINSEWGKIRREYSETDIKKYLVWLSWTGNLWKILSKNQRDSLWNCVSLHLILNRKKSTNFHGFSLFLLWYSNSGRDPYGSTLYRLSTTPTSSSLGRPSWPSFRRSSSRVRIAFFLITYYLSQFSYCCISRSSPKKVVVGISMFPFF